MEVNNLREHHISVTKFFPAVLAFVLIMLSFQPITAQKRSYFAAKISFDVSIPQRGWGLYRTGSGLQGGVVFNMPLSDKIYFEPGAELYYLVMGMTDVVEEDKIYESSSRNIGVRIPLNFGYRREIVPDLQLAVFTGPWLNFNIMARQYLTPNFDGPMTEGSQNLFKIGGWKRVDLQWGFGLSATYLHKYTLELAFGLGVSPIAKVPNKPTGGNHCIRRNLFAITLGYNF